MTLCVQELGGVYHASTPDDFQQDFPLMRSVSEGSGAAGTAAAGAWARGKAGVGSGAHSFATVVGSSFWDGEATKGGKRRSGGASGEEIKVPAPAVPQAPKGAWGKK